MSQGSPLELRILHAVRLLGFGSATAIAGRAEASLAETQDFLDAAEGRGWVHQSAFADLHGWSLTGEGRAENERQLATERANADPHRTIEHVYRDFRPLNARLLRACTDWQLKPTADDPFAANDHSDPAWDKRILAELDALGDALGPLNSRLTSILRRFAGYDTRFRSALRRAQAGDNDWVDKTHIDSCHRVWFQLHEDLIATLVVDRANEI